MVIQSIINWLLAHQVGMLIIVYEAIAASALKSNSIGQLILNALKSMLGSNVPPA
jgi:hypothetical protein